MTLYHGVSQCMQNSVAPSVETSAMSERIHLRRASTELHWPGRGARKCIGE